MEDKILALINRYLGMDDERAAELDKIEHKSVQVYVREWDKALQFCIERRRLQKTTDAQQDVDVHIDVSLKALPDYVLGTDQESLIKRGAIEIKGDAHVASVLQNTLREIEIDWEELLAKVTGDTLAHQLGQGLRSLLSSARQMRANLHADIRDYLQDTLQASATREEVDQFIHEVDELRSLTDRLEARINRLHKK